MRMPKCSGIPERAGVEVIAEHQFVARNSGRSYSNVNRHGVVDMTFMAALMWRMGGIGPMPNPSSPFLTVKNEADRRYGIELYLKEPVVFTACSTKGSANRFADLVPWARSRFLERKRLR